MGFTVASMVKGSSLPRYLTAAVAVIMITIIVFSNSIRVHYCYYVMVMNVFFGFYSTLLFILNRVCNFSG